MQISVSCMPLPTVLLLEKDKKQSPHISLAILYCHQLISEVGLFQLSVAVLSQHRKYQSGVSLTDLPKSELQNTGRWVRHFPSHLYWLMWCCCFSFDFNPIVPPLFQHSLWANLASSKAFSCYSYILHFYRIREQMECCVYARLSYSLLVGNLCGILEICTTETLSFSIKYACAAVHFKQDRKPWDEFRSKLSFVTVLKNITLQVGCPDQGYICWETL